MTSIQKLKFIILSRQGADILSKLELDHKRAKVVAQSIESTESSLITSKFVETNIVGLDLSKTQLTAKKLSELLSEEGILTSALGPKYLRLVLHCDIKIGRAHV